MKSVIILLCLELTAVLALPSRQRIIGGQTATISEHPFMVALLRAYNNIYIHSCGGIILTNGAILTVAHCVYSDISRNWRARVGSSFANSGGSVLILNRILVNSAYNILTKDNDAAILLLATSLEFSTVINNANYANSNYTLAENQPVWALGWGRQSVNAPPSEQLQRVQTWVVNQDECAQRYRAFIPNSLVTANMVCAGWLDIGGRDFCQGDAGGPLIHNNFVVGILSWGEGCSRADLPGVSTRISQVADWISTNAG